MAIPTDILVLTVAMKMVQNIRDQAIYGTCLSGHEWMQCLNIDGAALPPLDKIREMDRENEFGCINLIYDTLQATVPMMYPNTQSDIVITSKNKYTINTFIEHPYISSHSGDISYDKIEILETSLHDPVDAVNNHILNIRIGEIRAILENGYDDEEYEEEYSEYSPAPRGLRYVSGVSLARPEGLIKIISRS